MAYGQMKYSPVLPGTIYSWRLYRPTIKGLYSGQIWLVDELQKTDTVIGDFIYIVNMAKPGTNRH